MKESKHSVAIKMQTHKHYIGAMNSERSASTRNMRAIHTRPFLNQCSLYYILHEIYMDYLNQNEFDELFITNKTENIFVKHELYNIKTKDIYP